MRACKDRLSIRSPQGTSANVLAKLQEIYRDRDVTAVAQENVGPQIGLEFAKRAALALGLGMIGILIYVTFRFEFSFALGALVALIHDVIVTMGIFSLIGGELSLVMVGAILTIAGYSINDTIVVFDRIREGLKNRERGSIQSLMNTSINETLGRTILTGGTTLLSVGALYFFGGAVLRDFSFAILVGILSEPIPRSSSRRQSCFGGRSSEVRAFGAKSSRPRPSIAPSASRNWVISRPLVI